MKKLTAICLLLIAAPAFAEPTTLRLSPSNGRITFHIAHLLGSVEGSFENFRGQLKYDPQNLATSSISWEVNVRGINTGNNYRDTHLATAEYFDADKFPTLSFTSTSTRVVDSSHLEVTGKFTLKGVTKIITVPVTGGGQGFDSEFTVKRSDYGFTGGRPAVGDDVEVKIHLLPSASWTGH